MTNKRWSLLTDRSTCQDDTLWYPLCFNTSISLTRISCWSYRCNIGRLHLTMLLNADQTYSFEIMNAQSNFKLCCISGVITCSVMGICLINNVVYVSQSVVDHLHFIVFFFTPRSKIEFKKQGVWHCNINVDIDVNCWLLLHLIASQTLVIWILLTTSCDVSSFDTITYVSQTYFNFWYLLWLQSLFSISVINDANFMCFKQSPISIVFVSNCSIQQQFDLLLNIMTSMWRKWICHYERLITHQLVLRCKIIYT